MCIFNQIVMECLVRQMFIVIAEDHLMCIFNQIAMECLVQQMFEKIKLHFWDGINRSFAK